MTLVRPVPGRPPDSVLSTIAGDAGAAAGDDTAARGDGQRGPLADHDSTGGVRRAEDVRADHRTPRSGRAGGPAAPHGGTLGRAASRDRVDPLLRAVYRRGTSRPPPPP